MKISYALGRDASDTQPQMLLAADRNIFSSAAAVPATFANKGYGNLSGTAYSLPTNSAVIPVWTDKMHQKNGNLLISDGSVQQLSSAKLREQCRNSGDTQASPNMMWFP